MNNPGTTDPAQIADQVDSTLSAALVWLRPLSEDVVTARPAPDRWTVKEVVGHLIDSAANNHQRFVRGQFVGGGADFVFPKYEQNEWVGSFTTTGRGGSCSICGRRTTGISRT